MTTTKTPSATDLMTKITNIVVEMDTDGNKKISFNEFVDYIAAKLKKTKLKEISISREYIILYITIILAVVGMFSSKLSINWNSAEIWTTIGGFALVAGNIIYGGLLKSNFQKTLTLKETQYTELQATLDANKEALSKSTIENERLKNEVTFWKERYNEEKTRNVTSTINTNK